MIIALNLDMDDDENAVWIFPVRSGPDAVHVDVVDRADMKPRHRRFLFAFSLIYILLCTVTGWLLQMPLARS